MRLSPKKIRLRFQVSYDRMHSMSVHVWLPSSNVCTNSSTPINWIGLNFSLCADVYFVSSSSLFSFEWWRLWCVQIKNQCTWLVKNCKKILSPSDLLRLPLPLFHAPLKHSLRTIHCTTCLALCCSIRLMCFSTKSIGDGMRCCL